MWISLSRLQQCHQQDEFLLLSPGWFTIHTFIVAVLTPSEGQLLLRSCILLLIDRRDLCLSATALRLHYQGSNYTVPTPPLQAFIVLGQVGEVLTVWDQELSDPGTVPSSGSSAIEFSGVANALEEEHLDSVQEQ